MRICLFPPRAIGGVEIYIQRLKKHLAHWVEFVDNPKEADIVHVQLAWNMSAALAADIYTIHGALTEGNEDVIRASMQRASSVRHVIVPSHWQAAQFRRLGGTKPLTVIPHGIDLDKWRDVKVTSGEYMLWGKIFLARHVGNAEVIQVARDRPDLLFYTTLAEVSVPANVKVIGVQSYEAMQKVIAGCSVFIRNVKESFGIQTLEALACGKPVVALANSSSEEIITHCRNGYLFNDYRHLAEGLDFCRHHYQEMSEWARVSAMRFRWQEATVKTFEVYQQVMDDKRRK